MQRIIIKAPNQNHKRVTSLQFYCHKAEERRKYIKIPLKSPPPSADQPNLKSQREHKARVNHFENLIDRTSMTRIGSFSCCCRECGPGSKFKQKVFKLYPSTLTKFQKRHRIIRRFRKGVICIQFIIRYRIVQTIRERQRQKMKKALNIKHSIEPHRASALTNLLSAAAKQMKMQPQEDSDEDPLIKKKSVVNSLLSPKQQKQRRAIYYLQDSTNRPISQYIAQRASVSPQPSLLPPLSSFMNSHRKNHSCYLKKY